MKSKLAILMGAALFFAGCNSYEEPTIAENEGEYTPTTTAPDYSTNRTSTADRGSATAAQSESSDRSGQLSARYGQQEKQTTAKPSTTEKTQTAQRERTKPQEMESEKSLSSPAPSVAIVDEKKPEAAASQSSKQVVMASDLIGKEVKNPQEKELGSIEDLAIDLQSGKVSYAALSRGGFLGVGDKLIAVPMETLSIQSQGQGEDQEQTITLSASESQIEGAPGFSEENWPEQPTQAWGASSTDQSSKTETESKPSLNQRERSTDRSSTSTQRSGVQQQSGEYSSQQRSTPARSAQERYEEQAQAQKSGTDRERQQHRMAQREGQQDIKQMKQMAGAKQQGKAKKASELIGKEVHNRQNQKLGKVKDFVLDIEAGRIAYAVVTVEGGQEKQVVVPVNALSPDDSGKGLVLNADKEKLENAPEFDGQNLPRNLSWGAELEGQDDVGGKVGFRGDVEGREGKSGVSIQGGADFGRPPRDRELQQDQNQQRQRSDQFQRERNLNQRQAPVRERSQSQALQDQETDNPDVDVAIVGLQVERDREPGAEPRSATERQTNRERLTRPNQGQTDPRQAHQEGRQMAGQVTKASELIGKSIKNPQGEELGELEDLVINPQTGKVDAVVVSIGGFLDLGDKLVAVPIHALKKQAGEDALLMNADKQKLERAPKFDPENPQIQTSAWGAEWGEPGQPEAEAWQQNRQQREAVGQSRPGQDRPQRQSQERSQDEQQSQLQAQQQGQGQGSTSRDMADRNLTYQLQRAIQQDPQLSSSAGQVQVMVKNGQVHLTGSVRSEEEKQQIEERVKKMAGQSAKIENRLQVQQQPR